ncbi:MAG: CocE/NonD family hydrolase [Acidobacteria bacterium]|nr:CocE/NonD family hydrolase [Acidobacteriota bacterium]
MTIKNMTEINENVLADLEEASACRAEKRAWGRAWFIAALLLTAEFGLARAQAPNPGNYSSAKFAVQQSRGQRVAMRDGVHLSVDIYRPEASGQYPAVLSITPYDNNAGWKARAKWFAERGYVAVLADTRGRYDSEGEWNPFNPKQKTDGYDLVEWIAKQAWCNGRVGMYGPSYMGWETWWTATQAPPSLKAIVPEVAPPDQFRNTPYQDGVFDGWMLNWVMMMAGRTNQAPIVDPGVPDRLAQVLKHRPYTEWTRILGVMDAPWFDTWMQKNLSTAEYWKGISYQTPESYSKVTAPSLAVSGWFDSDHPGTPMNYVAMKQYGATSEARRPRLVIGPWVHWPIATRSVAGIDYGAEAAIDWDGYVTRWFDHFLKGIDNGVESDPPVHVFVMGANKWRAEEDWPLPETQWTKYYLSSQGRANSLKGDGLLTPTPPQTESSDTYVYDPVNPTQSPTGPNGQTDGPLDTRLSAIGDEVLVYQTPPLESPVEVTGPIEATLYAATSARDTDWFVRLVDVQPDGRSLLLAEGVMRARNRNPSNEGRFNSAQLSTIEPGKVYQYTIQFWRGTANVFQQGHRIRVEISSSWYPKFLPNLNAGADNVAMVSMSEAVIARQTVHHGPQYPSHILLPVIPARGAVR